MEKIFMEMSATLERIASEGLLIPVRVEPPTGPDYKDLGELPPKMKSLYTLIEVLLEEIKRQQAGPKRKQDQCLLSELELQRKIAADIFQLRLSQKYRSEGGLISVYSDWHVYEAPTVFE